MFEHNAYKYNRFINSKLFNNYILNIIISVIIAINYGSEDYTIIERQKC